MSRTFETDAKSGGRAGARSPNMASHLVQREPGGPLVDDVHSDHQEYKSTK